MLLAAPRSRSGIASFTSIRACLPVLVPRTVDNSEKPRPPAFLIEVIRIESVCPEANCDTQLLSHETTNLRFSEKIYCGIAWEEKICGFRETRFSERKNSFLSFSGPSSYPNALHDHHLEARMTGLEPATSGVTGRCSNQLSYIPRAKQRPARGTYDYAPTAATVKRQGLPATGAQSLI